MNTGRRAVLALFFAVSVRAQMRSAPARVVVPVPATAAAAAAVRAPAASAVLASPAASVSAALPLAAAAAVPATPANDDAPALRSLNAFWHGLRLDGRALFDGSAVQSPDAASAPLDPLSDRLAPWLATDDPQVAAALDRAVALARETRAGRAALAAAEKALGKQGRALPVLVKDLGRNWGEYDYIDENIRLHKKLFAPGAELALAGTLTHELRHVAQHADSLPAGALELEIEAHLQDLAMLDEHGAKPPKRTFARQLHDALRKSPDAFVELIQAAVPGLLFLDGTDLKAVIAQMEEELKDARKRAKRSPRWKAIAARIEKDLASLRSAEGAENYTAFSRRVMKALRQASAAARG